MKYYDNITEFIFVHDIPQKSDVIFIPGSRYGELAVHAAELYKQGMAKWIIPSGKYSILGEHFEGPITPDEYRNRVYETESDFFAGVLQDYGVPEEVILKEKEAVFTYENAIYSRKILEDRAIYREGEALKAIIVCQAFHARRSLMYYQYVFPGTEFYVCPVETKGISRYNWYLNPDKIDVVLGEVQRCGNQFYDIMKGTDKVWKRDR